MASLNNVYSIRATVDAGVFILSCNITDLKGETYDCDYCSRLDDEFGLGPVVREWLVEHDGEYAVEPYTPPAPAPYRISKSTPWLRMTDDEAELITGAMQQAPSRQRGIYDSASYLSSDDPLWGALHDMIATTLNSTTRADELLAPET